MQETKYIQGQKVIKKSSGDEMIVDRYEGSKLVCMYLDPLSGEVTGCAFELDQIEPFHSTEWI
ncbi:hypothetical protein [Leptospira kirschneri]|nr:hypothetical protein [Leptospira kirschneri]